MVSTTPAIAVPQAKSYGLGNIAVPDEYGVQPLDL